MATAQLLSSLRAMKKAVKERDAEALRRISTAAIETSAVKDGENFFLLALIAYMLSKMMIKAHYWDVKEKNRFLNGEALNIERCALNIEKGNEKGYRQCAQRILRELKELEHIDPRYVHDLETKARTKLAARLYAQGFSLSRAAELTGAHKRDLLAYAGRTLMADRTRKTKSMAERLKHVRKIFS